MIKRFLPRKCRISMAGFSWQRNKKPKERVSLEMPEIKCEEGSDSVVKGISKRIIVVKSPDPKIFEQAIFIIREDFAGEKGLSDKDILKEASRAASRYMGSKRAAANKAFSTVRGPLYAAVGAAATGLAWIAVQVSHL